MIRIAKVEWDFNYAWQDIRGLSSWSALRLNSALWHGLLMTTKVGQPMTISVTITPNPVNVGQSFLIAVAVTDS